MTTLLRIDASSRHDGSVSRRVGDTLVSQLAPQTTIVRDLANTTIPHLDETTIGAFFSGPAEHSPEQKSATRLSDALIAELEAADDIVITVPMYNFGIPSALKAWIDQVVRVGRTFSFDENGFQGLLSGKRAFVVIAYGSDGYTDGDFRAADFVEPYMTFVLNFIGIKDVITVPLEGTSIGKVDAALATAHDQIAGLLPRQAA